MSNADKYIDKYKQLEEVVRITYKLKNEDSISFYLGEQVKFHKFKEEIKYCQDVRNLLSHKKKLKDSFAVEPSDYMIQFIDNLIDKIKNRPKCCDIQIHKANVYNRTLNDGVKVTMEVMRKNLYTHVPILDGDLVIGVFDENSIFNYLADNEIVSIEDDLTFNDIIDYISLDNREMEEFVFFSANSYVEDLENRFHEAFNKNSRVGVAFITVNVKPSEPMQGIITPWDIIANQN